MEPPHVSQSTQPPSQGRGQGGGQPPSQGSTPRRSSTSPSGTPRAGRRASERRRPPEKTTLQRLRTPIIAGLVIVALLAVGFYVVQDAASPAYACTTVDTVQPSAPGELGQVQPDQGNQHVGAGDKVTYQICPPASGRHINALGRGPIEPQVYGPDAGTVPMGWIHNLEHGAVVVLYSCELGACDDATLQELQAMADGLPDSAICGISPGVLSVVAARFDQMPTRFAALVWNRVLYMDELDPAQINEFYLRYAERIDDGRFVAPPEPQCAVPSEAPSAAPSADPSGSGAPSEAPSAAPSAAPSEAPSAAPSAS
jgi:hypothetical protein